MSDAPTGRPRHRAPTAIHRIRLRTQAGLTAVLARPLVATTAVAGLAAATGVLSVGAGDAADATPMATSSVSAPAVGDPGAVAERLAAAEHRVSRDSARPELERGQVTPDRRGAEAGVGGKATVAAVSDPRDIAMSMLGDYGWDSSQFSCLDQLWVGESNWEHTATNPTSGAYGIPQALPASKMSTAGSDWRTNPTTQIEWGLGYIQDSYGSPCSANEFKLANNWY